MSHVDANAGPEKTCLQVQTKRLTVLANSLARYTTASSSSIPEHQQHALRDGQAYLKKVEEILSAEVGKLINSESFNTEERDLVMALLGLSMDDDSDDSD